MTENTSKTMLPDVEKFFAGKAEAEEKYHAAQAEYNAYREQRDVKLQELRLAADEAYAEWRAVNTNWDALTESTDPLIKWIGDNCKRRAEYAEIILKALPATYDEIEEISREQGWCDEFDRLLARAVDAGVIAASAKTEEYTQLLTWYRRHYDTDRGVEARVAKAIAAERAAAVEQYKAEQAADAKAENTTRA